MGIGGGGAAADEGQQGVRSVAAAAAGGAERVELCADLGNGGVTPSIGIVRTAAAILGARRDRRTRLHVLVRPRPGHYVYSDDEWAAVLADVAALRAAGADGVVLGALTPGGRVDEAKTGQAVRATRPMKVTFHRPLETLAVLSRLQVDYLLTSGRKPSALQGAACIRQLLQASSTVEIIAGCGVNLDNVAEIVQATGVRQVHAGSAVVCAYSDEAAMGSGVSMGPASAGREAVVSATCPEKVRELCRRCNNGEALEQSAGEAPLGHTRRSGSAFGIEITSDFWAGLLTGSAIASAAFAIALSLPAMRVRH